MQDGRMTIDDELINYLTINKIELVRFLLHVGRHCVIARIQEEKGEGYKGITPGLDTEEDEYNITFSQLKKDGAMKVKTSNKIVSIIDEAMETFSEYFTEYYYEEDSVYFKVTDDFKEMFDKVDNILNNGDGYILIDLNEFNKLRSKYDIYLYLKLKRFITTGLIKLSYEQMRELFGDTNIEITRRLKQSAEKLELILGKKIYVKNPEVKNRKSTTLTITFKAEQKEIKEPKEIVKNKNKRKSKAKEEKTKRMLDF